MKADHGAPADGRGRPDPPPIKPAQRPAAFEPFNQKRNSRCRPAAGVAGRHIPDNYKSQDAEPASDPGFDRAAIRLTAAAGGETHLLSAKQGNRARGRSPAYRPNSGMRTPRRYA